MTRGKLIARAPETVEPGVVWADGCDDHDDRRGDPGAAPESVGFDCSSSGTFAAISYVKGNIYSDAVVEPFVKYIQARFGNIRVVAASGCQ